MEYNDIENVKNRLKEFEIPKKERLLKLRLVQKLIENTDEENLNDNLKSISKMLFFWTCCNLLIVFYILLIVLFL